EDQTYHDISENNYLIHGVTENLSKKEAGVPDHEEDYPYEDDYGKSNEEDDGEDNTASSSVGATYNVFMHFDFSGSKAPTKLENLLQILLGSEKVYVN
ncbi:unnamed protein product, partial [Strongylus vulgaris]